MKWFDGCKTIAEAEKLHKKLAMKYHPDKNPGDKEAESKFKDCRGL